MTDTLRWAARFHVAWRPVLTFRRRRGDYLDWLDQHVDPVFFRDREEEEVGVAANSDHQRLTVQRDGVILDLRSPAADVQDLVVSLDGAFETLSPSDARAHQYRGQWSSPVVGNYDELRERLAGRLFNRDLGLPNARVVDGAYLMNGETDSALMLFEFGFVDSSELRQRVRHPELYRRLAGIELPSPHEVKLDVPPTSLYVDLAWRPKGSVLAPNAHAALEALVDLEAFLAGFVEELAGAVQ